MRLEERVWSKSGEGLEEREGSKRRPRLGGYFLCGLALKKESQTL